MTKRIMDSFNDLLFGKKIPRSVNYLQSNIELISNLDSKKKKYLIECINKKNNDKEEWNKNFRSNIFLASLMIEGLDKATGISMLRNSLKYTNILEEKLEIMWNLFDKDFKEKETIDKHIFIHDIFIEIINELDILIPVKKELDKKDKRKGIVIIINQFLSISHAPTRDTLEYAKSLVEMGYETYIVVTNEMPTYPNLPLLKPFIANMVESYKNEVIVDY